MGLYSNFPIENLNLKKKKRKNEQIESLNKGI